VLGVEDEKRIAIVRQGQVLPGMATLREFGETGLTFTVNTSVVADFRRACGSGLASAGAGAWLDVLKKEITEEELAEIERERGERDLAEAIALYLQAGNALTPLAMDES
jgi:hypothetical protein